MTESTKAVTACWRVSRMPDTDWGSARSPPWVWMLRGLSSSLVPSLAWLGQGSQRPRLAVRQTERQTVRREDIVRGELGGSHFSVLTWHWGTVRRMAVRWTLRSHYLHLPALLTVVAQLPRPPPLITGLHNKLISPEISFGFGGDQVRAVSPRADIYVLAEFYFN